MEIWNSSQRRALIVLMGLLAIYLAVRVVRNRTFVSDPQPPRGARFDELADRLDPNTATWEELAALPTLGEKRARTIVEFREKFAALHAGDIAFRKTGDLTKVKGIGAATVETIEPHLMFPGCDALPSSRVSGPR